MAKMVDFYSDREVQDIMDAFLERFPMMFDGFDSSKIGFVTKKDKKAKIKPNKPAIKLMKVGFPYDVWMNKTYVVVAAEGIWKNLDSKRKNLSVFRTMCAIPQGGFDEQSDNYGKIKQPDIKMFMREYAAAGCIPNWEENPAAKDPMAQTSAEVDRSMPVVEAISSEVIERKAVTVENIASVTTR